MKVRVTSSVLKLYEKLKLKVILSVLGNSYS